MSAGPKALLLVAVGLLATVAVIGLSLLTAAPVKPPPHPLSEQQAQVERRIERDRHARPPRRVTGRAERSQKPTSTVPDPEPAGDEHEDPLRMVKLLAILLATSTGLGLLSGVAIVVVVVRRRLTARRTREYGRYEVRLSAHDETKREDLEDTVEALVAVVRQTLDRRWKDGQPHFAIELHYGPAGSGMEWTICVVCEPRIVKQLDAVLIAAYPDVRIGYEFIADPQPIRGTLPTPRHIVRFRKKRMFVFGLLRGEGAGRREKGAPLMELIAQAQVGAEAPSTVRLTLTPAIYAMERVAARLLERQENVAARKERAGMTEAGMRSQQHQHEMRGAQPSINRSLCWFEVMVASDDDDACKSVSAAVEALRGENRLHRRTFDLRPERTRRRFVDCEPPLLPLVWFNWLAPPFTIAFGLRTLLSSTEIARFLELPTARLRAVPVRRLMLPRLPAPPEIMRATDLATIELPYSERDDDFDESAFVPQSTPGEVPADHEAAAATAPAGSALADSEGAG